MSGFRRIAILGIGLIGGSVAAAVRARALAEEIVGFAPEPHAAQALEAKLIDRAAANAAEAVDGAQLVVLAAPIPALPRLFEEISVNLTDDALLTDVASTKQSTISAARLALGARFANYLAAHPIAGGERHGPQAARADLFEGCLTLLCPQTETSEPARDQVGAFWESLGARVSEIDAIDHDRIFAEVSHWPHAMVFALCAAIAAGSWPQDALRFAGAGLRDTTRIGASSPELWTDILLDNRDAVLACAGSCDQQVRAVTSALRTGDRQRLLELFSVGARWRSHLPTPGR
ncbi:MAG: prephenate dehydrogenase/arogenate dehydrogenase family protein [Quisquiliibacterium sp.]